LEPIYAKQEPKNRQLLEREVFYLGVSFKLKGLHHAPWETDSFLNCFAQGHANTKRPWNALVIVLFP